MAVEAGDATSLKGSTSMPRASGGRGFLLRSARHRAAYSKSSRSPRAGGESEGMSALGGKADIG